MSASHNGLTPTEVEGYCSEIQSNFRFFRLSLFIKKTPFCSFSGDFFGEYLTKRLIRINGWKKDWILTTVKKCWFNWLHELCISSIGFNQRHVEFYFLHHDYIFPSEGERTSSKLIFTGLLILCQFLCFLLAWLKDVKPHSIQLNMN